jgi:uncharacterized membrane protein YeaQ/YmgE (transglycosylase-associated protein family)
MLPEFFPRRTSSISELFEHSRFVASQVSIAGTAVTGALEANCRGRTMNMSNESLLVVLFVGLVAGWLAGQLVQGTGFGIIGDLIVGILGAFVGSWLLPQLGIHLGAGVISAIVNATIGAILLLLIARLFRGGSGWRSRWGGGGWGSRWGSWGPRW